MIPILGWAAIVLLSAAPAMAQEDPMRAPPAEELDRQSDEWIQSRRWMALIIIGGTLIAGGGASFIRRRNRRRAARVVASPAWPPTEGLRRIDPVMRTDRLRKALRAGLTPPAEERPALESLYDTDSQAPLRVLVLEALSAGEQAPPVEFLERALKDRADSVRSAALHLLLTGEPERAVERARAHIHDPGIEARTQCAEVLADVDPETAGTAMLDIARAEALGPRESHVLRRAMGFFAEELKDPAWVPRIEALRIEVEDEEGMIDWAIEKLREA
jgi:hypothetical protein